MDHCALNRRANTEGLISFVPSEKSLSASARPPDLDIFGKRLVCITLLGVLGDVSP